MPRLKRDPFDNLLNVMRDNQRTTGLTFNPSLLLGYGNAMFQSRRIMCHVAYEAATDRAGLAELLSGFYSYAQWRGNGHINYRNDIHNVHLAAHYYQGVNDLNRILPVGCSAVPRNPVGPCLGFANRDSHVTYDAIYMVDLPWQTVLTFTIANFTDEEPPYIRSQYNYDYMNYSWLGRTFKLGIKMNIGG